WIENKLLQTAIPDHRKYTVELVLAPYLINIKHLPVGYTYSLIKHWIFMLPLLVIILIILHSHNSDKHKTMT
ncbi:MAG TPA: hypothetical protein VFJ51_06455, partial [Nitrososphaeraceae archaeon]|nr:hypothetical protein [Nitrososphaeraceae archaeon]